MLTLLAMVGRHSSVTPTSQGSQSCLRKAMRCVRMMNIIKAQLPQSHNKSSLRYRLRRCKKVMKEALSDWLLSNLEQVGVNCSLDHSKRSWSRNKDLKRFTLYLNKHDFQDVWRKGVQRLSIPRRLIRTASHKHRIIRYLENIIKTEEMKKFPNQTVLVHSYKKLVLVYQEQTSTD